MPVHKLNPPPPLTFCYCYIQLNTIIIIIIIINLVNKMTIRDTPMQSLGCDAKMNRIDHFSLSL